MASYTKICSFQLCCCQDAHAPKLGGQTAACQQVSTSPLQNTNSHLCCGVGVRVVSLRRRLVNGMVTTVLRELCAQELSAAVAVQPEEENMREIPVVIVDLG